ncbi:MAG: hypothetical protein HY704_16255 [Gemmatimonadetes bacterium]|nr:hypothetical protein [Gemmatimonadota bacterium]
MRARGCVAGHRIARRWTLRPGAARSEVGVLLALAVVAGCEPDRRDRAELGTIREGAAAGAGAVGEARPISYQIFNEEPATFAPGRLTLHILVPEDAGEEQVRQMLVNVLTQRGQADTTVVVARAIAYKPVSRSSREAELVPVGWGEWLPPDGWADASALSRTGIHRVYTYFGVQPVW